MNIHRPFGDYFSEIVVNSSFGEQGLVLHIPGSAGLNCRSRGRCCDVRKAFALGPCTRKLSESVHGYSAVPWEQQKETGQFKGIDALAMTLGSVFMVANTMKGQ